MSLLPQGWESGAAGGAPPSTVVGALAAHAPPSLIAPPAWRRIESFVSTLPAAFFWGIFECRLAPADERVDMLLCASRRHGGDGALGRALEGGAHRFGPITPFLQAWVEPDGPLADVPLIWIEHDLLAEGPSAPFVQFCVDPSYPVAHETPLEPSRLRALAARGAGLLLGEPANDGAMDRLAACAARLPEGGRIVHVGVIPHRGSRDLRVLAGVPTFAVQGWLAAIGWPGDQAIAADFLSLLGAHVPLASVQLDLGDAVRPTLALEFPLLTRPDRDPRWSAFIESLVARGLASPEKGRAALGWIGDATYDLPGAPWLTNVQRQLDIKLVLSADGTCEAKAYLCFHPRFVLL
ncbi:hypothetical protein [Pendulispora albinea]|uniref:Uncharacterized protein n=1 Tax=Pendulispora albinea TaxID=2741071 RepID=A0ABZ2LRE3_9BACT